MSQDGPHSLAEQLVVALKLPGTPQENRPVHAFGWGAQADFYPSPVAQNYCNAFHFQNNKNGVEGLQPGVKVTMRFSNGSGSGQRRDSWSDVRGMAVRFHKDEATATDLIAMTLPEFFTSTPEGFAEFAQDAKLAPCKKQSPWQKLADMLHLIQPMSDPDPGQTERPDEGAIRYADKYAEAQLAVLQAAAIGAPQSYLRATYHAVHTFRVTGEGGTRMVRFEWRPVDGVRPLDLSQMPDEPDNFLVPDLKRRLAPSDDGLQVKTRPARFALMMSVGENGDKFTDPSRPWPPRRKRVFMGMLTLREACDTEKISFNPGLLTDGIEATDDAIFWTRIEAYRYSSKLRGGVPCPFAKGR